MGETKQRFYYGIYGKTIVSDLYFPQLVVLPERVEEDADIVIRAGVLPPELKELEKQKSWEFGDTVSWLSNLTCRFLVENGRTITYELKDGGKEAALRNYLLGFGLSMLHLQRGEMAIHCSALQKDGKAILISGNSGSGKSTTTAALLEQGFTLLADDVAVVREENGRMICYPAFPYQKLCRNVVEQGDYDRQKLIYINEDKDKFLVPYEGPFTLDGKELCAFFCLGVLQPDATLRMEEIVGIQKLHACVNNLFLRRLMGEERYSPFIGSRCLEIASKVRMFFIGRPDGADTLKERVNYITEQWKNC